MIDRDEIRIARRTAERNGYTVLPPREDDERDLNRFRQRQQEREDYRSSRPAPSRRFRDEVEDYDDEPVRKSTKPMARSTNYEDDEVDTEQYDYGNYYFYTCNCNYCMYICYSICEKQ